MSYVTVKAHAPGGTIVMDRPEMGNALSLEMVEQLEQALDDLHQEKKIRYVILTGAGHQFCTGMDLRELHQLRSSDSPEASDQMHDLWVRIADLLQKMLRFPKPLIAAVDGNAMGAGLALMLAADIVIASEKSTFVSPANHVGLIGGLVAPLLTFRVGGGVAANMMLTGQTLDAQQAAGAHLVREVVRSDQVWVVADQVGKQCAAGPAESIQLTKRLLNETIGETIVSQLVIGAGMGATACSTDAGAEGLAAFNEKRSPVWP